MFDAIFLDFYGTVVHEDDVIIDQICSTISASAPVAPVTPNEVGSFWWAAFSDRCTRSHGESFRTQRSIERWSLAHTIEHFGLDSGIDTDPRCDPDSMSEQLFEHWQRPPIFADAQRFLDGVDLPVVVVSNIDRRDIEAAIAVHQLSFEEVITSEDVRSYKPRPELFRAGLVALDLPPNRVLHVGDSLTSDVAGAAALDIPVAWVNRKGKPRRPQAPDQAPDHEVSDLEQLLALFTRGDL